MLFIGFWRWYINITKIILNIIHRPVFYSKQNFSKTGFCLRLQVEPTQLGPIDGANLRFWKFQIKDEGMDNIQNCDSHVTLIVTNQ
jgi:hypothetical protein